MWDKPIWERVASLETNVPNIMQEIREIKKTMTDFIKEIRDNYATKKELNEVKDKICNDEESEVTKEVAKTNNKWIIIVAIIYLVMNLWIALIGLLK